MRDDIGEILAKADELIAGIAGQYAFATRTGELKGVSKIDVKMTLEQLRSVLDYLAIDVDTVLYQGQNVARTGHRIYFPYNADIKRVESSLKKQYLDLDVQSPAIQDLIHSVQSYRQGSDWLNVLCTQTNGHKHSGLTKHEPKSKGHGGLVVGNNAVLLGPGASATFTDCVFDGVPVGWGAPVTLHGDMSAQYASTIAVGIPMRRVAAGYVCFLAGTKWDVLDLLTRARHEIGTVSEAILKELGI